MTIATTRLTLDEFPRRPEEKPALEYEDGVVIQKVSPKNRHGWLQSFLAERANASGRRRGGFPELFPEPDLGNR